MGTSPNSWVAAPVTCLTCSGGGAGIILLPDQRAIGCHGAVGTEHLVEIEPKGAPGDEEVDEPTAATSDATAGPGDYATDDFEPIDKVGGTQVEDDMRKDIALGLDGAPHKPAGGQVAIDEHLGVAQRHEVLSDECIEHDFEIPAAFEHPQGYDCRPALRPRLRGDEHSVRGRADLGARTESACGRTGRVHK